MKNKFYLEEEKLPKLVILKGLAYSLPIVYYINELTIPGDMRSCHTTSVNQYALDFICRSQSQLRGMGINIFRQIVHPDDLAALWLSLKTIYPAGSNMTLSTTMRLRPYGQTNYRRFNCSKTVMETFSDGSVKKILIGASDVTNLPLPGHRHVPTPEELIRLKNGRIFSTLSKREREVLLLIVNGMDSKDIAGKLKISLETIRKHRSNLIKKSDAKNMAALVALAIKSWGF